MMEVKILSELDHPNIVKLEGFYKERQVTVTLVIVRTVTVKSVTVKQSLVSFETC
jgi:serine/threonine protein kinase